MTESRISAELLPPRRSPRWVATGALVATLALVALVIAADGQTLLDVAGRIDPRTLLLPLFCTATSYLAMAVSYQRIAQAAGLDVPLGEMVRITLASTAANYLLSTGGLSGLAVRSYYFSRHHRVSSGNAVSISLAQTFITNLVLFAFLLWGLLTLLFYDEVSGTPLVVVCFFFLVSLCLCVAAIAVVASRGARLTVFAAIMRIPDLLSRIFSSRREALRARFALFEEELHEGVDFLIARGRKMLSPFFYICLDWLLMLATLYAAFRCVQQSVAMHIVVIGFSTGVLLSIVNLVPGGLGIMEGSMAAVFAALGVPLEAAVVATLLFRASYYLLPLLVSLLFCRQLLTARASILRPTRSVEPPGR